MTDQTTFDENCSMLLTRWSFCFPVELAAHYNINNKRFSVTSSLKNPLQTTFCEVLSNFF